MCTAVKSLEAASSHADSALCASSKITIDFCQLITVSSKARLRTPASKMYEYGAKITSAPRVISLAKKYGHGPPFFFPSFSKSSTSMMHFSSISLSFLLSFGTCRKLVASFLFFFVHPCPFPYPSVLNSASPNPPTPFANAFFPHVVFSAISIPKVSFI